MNEPTEWAIAEAAVNCSGSIWEYMYENITIQLA